MASKALEINLARSRVDVTIREAYGILQEVMSRYHGIMEGLNTFLKELCHPYRNWEFIVKEARGFALDYFHLFKTHPKGPEAAKLYVDIFQEAINNSRESEVKADAVDNLLLYLQKIIKDSGKELNRFLDVLDYGFELIRCWENENFFLFVKSFYPINRLAKRFLEKAPSETNFASINSLLHKYLEKSYSYWLGEEDPLGWFNKEAADTTIRSDELRKTFYPISHEQLSVYQNELESVVQEKEWNSKALLYRRS